MSSGHAEEPPAKKKKGEKEHIGTDALRILENPAWTAYYTEQLGLPKEEFAAFEACLRTALPVTWRFSGQGEDSVALRESMQRVLLPALAGATPFPLPWYPSELGWQFDVSRAALRGKDWSGADAPDGPGRTVAVKALHRWLLRETNLGRVQRQEAVSMVPPLLLDVRPGHTVLDLCASPGSKTQQMLEMLQGTCDSDTGLVVANDADIKRCHLLASRASRLNSPGLVVSNHDARLFPEVLRGGGGDAGPSSSSKAVPLAFDRVLADVPCSGDGTMRKTPLIWKRWTAAPGNMLHSLQLQIAHKAVRLAAVGGRIVYSTCSLNPIENEAVVARVLHTFGPACVRLVDVSALLPALPRRPGLRAWKVWHRGQWHATWQSVVERFPNKCPKLESLFAPATGDALAAMHLERCVRLMPHDNDGSGFFIAVFEKVGAHAESAGQLSEDEPEQSVLDGVASFFGLGGAFPASRLVARSPTGRTLLLLTEAVLDMLRADTAGKLKVVHTGVRVFEREEAKGCALDCGYRVCHDGIPHAIPYQSAQVLPCNLATATAILQSKSPVSTDDLARTDEALAHGLRQSCKPGSVVLQIGPAGSGTFGVLHFPVLYAPSRLVSAMVKPVERESLLFRLGVESDENAPLAAASAPEE